ncbi:molecular chaperone DnaJ [Pseudanabaena sp. FACHB-1277]|jgi:hypothetical protein|uniref:Molecular chaperone DnaJ n=1 Tax=Pseudanabaena cinerea FACHB-1277 TaxID=2949581 RepID=A0A926UTB2_9CYAN|nr:molecular chaperone DnaJ [Pseudanabaena cinerea]MBD2149757.1 molecular chaperone DnaJ [Pseudanabaena cinerea FACHB-1277]
MERNPYDILGLTSASSKAEITKAMATAMKQKAYPIDAIAKAQKALMKPEERLVADFLCPILPTLQRFERSDLSALQEELPTLEILPEFEGLGDTIRTIKDVSELDLQFGQTLADSLTLDFEE